MAWKSALNTSALSLILSLQAVGTGSFFIPAEAINSPANSVHRPSTPQLPLNWQTVQPSAQTGNRANSKPPGAAWNNFQPPEQGVPGRREGGGTRGLACPTPITALIPQSTMGQTRSAKPTFFYYLPTAVDKTVQFELADERDNTVYKKSFRMVTSRGGIVSVKLGSDGNSPALEVGKNYQWYFTIKCRPQSYTIDIHPDCQGTGILKPHDLNFCFECNCLHSQRDLVLCSLSRTNPASPAVLCIEYQQKSLLFDSRVGLPILPTPLFPVYLFFFPVAVVANLLIRVYVHIVAGGSWLTNYIVTQSRPKRTGFLPNFSMMFSFPGGSTAPHSPQQ